MPFAHQFQENIYAIDMGVTVLQAKAITALIKDGQQVTLTVRPYWQNGKRDPNVMGNIGFYVDNIKVG
jgi:hypothetical protein